MQPGTESFWSNDKPPISGAMRDVLVHYSGIPEAELETHVQAVRDKAWQVFKFPCIGLYAFIRLNAPTQPVYSTVIERLKAGETLLDLGCCVGQETRKLIYDGAPAENVAGFDLERRFIEYGYDLFKDQDKLPTRFYTGDIFSTNVQTVGGQPFDIVMAIYFFHLFDWNEGVLAMKNVVHLLKAKPGSMIFGLQFGAENARSLPHSSARSGECFGHNPQSWSKLVQQVADEIGMSLEVDAQFGSSIAFMNNGPLGSDFRWLSFSITIPSQRTSTESASL